MSGISTGVGIFSGINSAQLIEQLLAIDARPRLIVQNRVLDLQQQRAAFLDINTSLLALKTAATKFRTSKTFDAATATSSDTAVLTATASSQATPGTHTFLVDRLVSTQQELSRGFADSDLSGLGATRFTFENGGGGLSTQTELSELNGGAGVQRGKILVTDKAGGTATIDLSRAVSVDDVLNAINGTGTIQVTAALDGDNLMITDVSGGTGALSVQNVFGSTTATSLGIEQTLGGGGGNTVLTGTQVRSISGITPLSILNGATGVHIGASAATGSESPDFTITDRNGTAHQIFLGELTTTTVDPGTGETTVTVDQNRAATLQDVIDIINAKTAGAVTASIGADGVSLRLDDTTGGTGNLTVADNVASSRTAASDLGIATTTTASFIDGGRLVAGLNSQLTRLLNGGAGLTATSFSVTDRTGANATVNVAAADLTGSISDLLSAINTDLGGIGAQAQVNDAGNGIQIVDTSGGTGSLVVSGALSDELNLSGTVSANILNGASAQLQWITQATRLDSLNAGEGIGTGEIRVTNAAGQTTTVTIGDTLTNVDDLVRFLNGAANGFTAAINTTGDGILITDTSTGAGTLKIEDVSGSVARKLNLEGSAKTGNIFIDGTFEREVLLDANDTLDDVARKISEAGVAVVATVINDGSAASPYRLSLAARNTGNAGRTIIDTGGLDLSLSAMAAGDDAVVFFGGSDPASSVLLTSSTNTLDSVIRGVTVDLASASGSTVDVTVTRDLSTIESDIDGFVEAFNDVLGKLDQYDRFDSETETRGTLFGDGTVSALRTSLLSTIQGTPLGLGGTFDRLFEVGVSLGTGGKLEFDRDEFRSAFEADATEVADLFAARELVPKETFTTLSTGVQVRNVAQDDQFTSLGVAELIGELMESYTSSVDGRLTNKNEDIDALIKIQEDRIGQLTQRLDNKRARLERQFIAMEQAIAQLQSQSQALTILG